MEKRDEEAKKEASPVMKQLARAMSKEELTTVSGAVSRFCDTMSFPPDPDFQN